MIKQLNIKNFKKFKNFSIKFHKGINVIVGNNEEGKTTILEAINLVTNCYFKGKFLKNDINEQIFNKDILKEYFSKINNKKYSCDINPPEIIIEIFFEKKLNEYCGDLELISGKKNEESGVQLKICLNNKFESEYYNFVSQQQELSSLPIEYYEVQWQTFSREEINNFNRPLNSVLIESGFTKFNNGSDLYINQIFSKSMDNENRINILQAVRGLKNNFSKNETLKIFTNELNNKKTLTTKELTLGVDLGLDKFGRGLLVTELDGMPFDFVGKGEQSIIKTELALKSDFSKKCKVILMEEPECHLSHSKMNSLISMINNVSDKQIIITTHSSFVTSRLGFQNVLLLNNGNVKSFNETNEENKGFFSRVYKNDILRMILCKKVVLVEGESDSLIFNKSFYQEHNLFPSDIEIEIICVGTAFKRFLDLADFLGKKTAVLTDNDGNIQALEDKYSDYINKNDLIRIFYSKDLNDYRIFEDEISSDEKKQKCLENIKNWNTLEPEILKCNKIDYFNKLLGNKKSKIEVLSSVVNGKTEFALKIFNDEQNFVIPKYIKELVYWINQD